MLKVLVSYTRYAQAIVVTVAFGLLIGWPGYIVAGMPSN